MGALLLMGILGPVLADSTVDRAIWHVYGADVGWMDARADDTNGMVLGCWYCSGHTGKEIGGEFLGLRHEAAVAAGA